MNVKAEELHFSYGSTPVLHDLNFELDGPKIYGLLGRNGVGKTSLLSLIGSFREPTSGKVLINGQRPFENADVMQEVAFMYAKDFSGETDSPLKYAEAFARYRTHFDLAYAKQLLKKFKLDKKVALQKLSLGQKSAFNAVAGLASRAPITIFDEVYLGMDAPARSLFYKELLQDQERHPRMIILSTHLASEMDYLFDEVIIMKEGNILLHEPIDELVSQGVTVVGNKQSVEAFTAGREVLNEEELGDTRSVTLFGSMGEDDRTRAAALGLEMNPVSLQDLFIHLTRGEEETI